jgi:hypothetical protein
MITTQTVEWLLSGLVEEELEVRRFANLVVEATDGAPLQEDDWVGHVLTVGGACGCGWTCTHKRCVRRQHRPGHRQRIRGCCDDRQGAAGRPRRLRLDRPRPAGSP